MRGSGFQFGLVLFMPVLCLAAAAPARQPEKSMAVDGAQESALLRWAGPEARIHRTAHFVVAHDVSPALVEELSNRLERTYAAVYRFCEIIKFPAHRPDRRLEVLFFHQRSAYDAYAQTIRFSSEGTYGVYNERSNRSAFFNAATDPVMVEVSNTLLGARANLDALTEQVRNIRDRTSIVEIVYPDGRSERLTPAQAADKVASDRATLARLEQRRRNLIAHVNRTVIQHETAHQVLHNAGVHRRGAKNPRWVVEGLALLFETPPSQDGSGFSGVNYLRLQDFREAIRGQKTASQLSAEDLKQAIADGRLVEPQRLIGDQNLFDRRGTDGAVDYALAWSLIHYLHRARGADLARYLHKLSERPPKRMYTAAEEVAVFEECFGPLDARFLRRWGSYVLSLNSNPPVSTP